MTRQLLTLFLVGIALLFIIALTNIFLSQALSIEDTGTVQIALNDKSGNTSDIEYRKIAGVDPSLLQLDVYSKHGLKKAPVVIFIHGGSWTSGDKTNVQKANKFVDFFQRNDIILVSANIRLMRSSLSPGTTYREQASDVASVIRWVHDHIVEYGGDPDRIVLFGFSSGAHLVALVGTDERYLSGEGLSFSAIDGVISFDVDAYDIPRAVVEGRDYDYPAAATNLPIYFTVDKKVQEDASPISHIGVSGQYPPFLVVYAGEMPGYGIQKISKRQSELFVDALHTAHVPATLYGDMNITHTQLVMNFGYSDFELTGVVQKFLDELF